MLRALLRLAGRPVPARPDALVGAAATLVGFTAAELAPLIRHAEGGPALRLEGGTRDPLGAAYLTALGRGAEFPNKRRKTRSAFPPPQGWARGDTTLTRGGCASAQRN